jgi:hypothetical protein
VGVYPSGAAQFQHHLFREATGVPVVDVFHGGRLTELGVSEQALEPLVVTIGLLVLHKESDKVGMGEVGLFGAVKTLLKSPGHAEEF